MTHVLTRPATCRCGAEFTQTGYEEPFTQAAKWFPFACEKCRGATAEAIARMERGTRSVRHTQAVAALTVPPLYAAASFDTFTPHGSDMDQARQRRLVALARQYVKAWPTVEPLFVFTGAPGTGKGHLAWSIAKAVAAAGAAVRVVKCADMVRELRASWRDDTAQSEEKVLRRLRELDLLVIDEVSRHAFYGQQIHQHLYDVIDHRVEYQRPTLLTTNEDAQGIAEVLRPALVDRLNGAGGIWEFGAASWRSRTVGGPTGTVTGGAA